MGWKEFRVGLAETRRDWSDLLFHFTKSTKKGHSAFDVLRTILAEERLAGGTGFIKGNHKCVCFTESPIAELAGLFRLLKRYGDTRYEPYGIAIKKSALFKLGGRPVLYQPDNFAGYYSADVEHLHVKYDLESDVDWTWEREWRIKAEALSVKPDDVLVVVPTTKEARQLDLKWKTVSLDLFDLER